MSKAIGPFRHIGTVALLGPRGFEAARGTRDAISRPARKRTLHIDDAALARAIKAGVAQGMAQATAKLKGLNKAAAVPAADRLGASLDNLRTSLTAFADNRRPRGRS